jgi:hypothetical protein
VTTIQTIEQIKKKSTSKAAAMWLASSNERLVLPPNMNMAVKSANAAGRIAVSVPFMSFCLAGHIKKRWAPTSPTATTLNGLPWRIYRDL